MIQKALLEISNNPPPFLPVSDTALRGGYWLEMHSGSIRHPSLATVQLTEIYYSHSSLQGKYYFERGQLYSMFNNTRC